MYNLGEEAPKDSKEQEQEYNFDISKDKKKNHLNREQACKPLHNWDSSISTA